MISQKFIYKFFSPLALLRILLAQKSLVKTFSARENDIFVRPHDICRYALAVVLSVHRSNERCSRQLLAKAAPFCTL